MDKSKQTPMPTKVGGGPAGNPVDWKKANTDRNQKTESMRDKNLKEGTR